MAAEKISSRKRINDRLSLSTGISSGFFFALMNTIISAKLSDVSPFVLLFTRGILSVLILFPFSRREIPFLFHKNALSLHLRCLSGALAVMCLYWTLGHTSATHGSFMNSLAPFFLTLLAFRFSADKPSRVQFVAIGLILGGSAFVAGSPDLNAPPVVWVVGILGAFLQAVAMLFLKSSTGRHSSAFIVGTLGLYLCLVGLLNPPINIEYFLEIPLGWMIAAAIVATAGQMLMTHSYRFLSPQIANVLGRSIILWAALLDYIFTGRIPGVLEGIGYGFAIAGMVLIQAEMSRAQRRME